MHFTMALRTYVVATYVRVKKWQNNSYFSMNSELWSCFCIVILLLYCDLASVLWSCFCIVILLLNCDLASVSQPTLVWALNCDLSHQIENVLRQDLAKRFHEFQKKMNLVMWKKSREQPLRYILTPQIAFHGTRTKSLPSIGKNYGVGY